MNAAGDVDPSETSETGDSQDTGPGTGRVRRRRRLWLPVAAGAVALVTAGAGYWFLERGAATEAEGQAAAADATDTVTRGTISATESWDATLGHGSPLSVTASAQGTVTRMAEQASTVERGTELYRLDETPVTALYGTVPMYRDLEPGDIGADVEQLEANLSALGYDGFDVDGEYTWYTQLAVLEWQEDTGAEETGDVSRPEVVFVPGEGRVEEVAADVGTATAPGTEVLTVSGGDQIATLEADVSDLAHMANGDEVSVVLPGGEGVTGTITSVSVVADPDAQENSSGSEDSVAEVEVTLAEEVDASLLGGPVDVVLAVADAEDVLSVPVSALLALAEGGYGLEVVADDRTTSIVPVETGLYADGRVEVSGEGIEEGTVVGVAGR
ncbi:peptidoglycan-binding protein [Nocardiopsis sp. NPDC050513]|uniref:peptidoglycan-binding protein n=1 Tax=Nocardiopsis sp. NPDC050513 TaxID=3364338 RepID=UPI0037A683B7